MDRPLATSLRLGGCADPRRGNDHRAGTISVLRDIERELGYRSSWNFPALRYPVDESVVAALRDEGCEIGVHGAYHDGRDLESLQMLDERLPAMRAAALRWGAEGFRSPATQRRWEWMPRLGFGYDTTFPDTDPYEPQPGGSCAWWPYHNETLVELPITMPQDHTLVTILRRDAETTWLDKARTLRERAGMALFLTHPDYLGTPEASAPYRRTLLALAEDATAWRALPREVAGWWRRRADSMIEWDGGGWRVSGPRATTPSSAWTRPRGSGDEAVQQLACRAAHEGRAVADHLAQQATDGSVRRVAGRFLAQHRIGERLFLRAPSSA